MDVEAYESNLQAKKSWFLFDEEIVCLGAGITCTEGRNVETIVENRKVNTEPIKEDIEPHGSIVYLNGDAEDSDIGYYFPTDCSIEIMTEIRIDSWSSINKNSGANRNISNAFAEIVINHGMNPQEDTYQYVIILNVDRNGLRAYSNNSPVEILENSTSVQAVRQRKLGITGVNFWTNEICSAGGITCHGKASVMLQEEEGRITLAVSDPTWHNEQGIIIELNQPATKVFAKDHAIKVMQMSPSIKLFVETKGAEGKSYQIKLQR